MTPRPWTTPDELRRSLRKEWDRGAVLRGEVDGLSVFPFRFRMTRPTAVELSTRFDDVTSDPVGAAGAPRPPVSPSRRRRTNRRRPASTMIAG